MIVCVLNDSGGMYAAFGLTVVPQSPDLHHRSFTHAHVYMYQINAGRLPSSYWDPVTKWKFDALLDMFRRNLELDAELLAIPGQKVAVAGAGAGGNMAVMASQ